MATDDDEEAHELEGFTTTELFCELVRRYVGLLLVIEKQSDTGDTDNDTHLLYSGGRSLALGLACAARASLSRPYADECGFEDTQTDEEETE